MATKPQAVNLIRVIDGDTVVIKKRGLLAAFHGQKRIRLYGIDAPESDQKGGDHATRYLKKIVGRGSNIRMLDLGRDHYGRTVGLIYDRSKSPRQSYNREMVAAGHARWYQRYGTGPYGFKQAENHARSKRLGIWRDNSAEAPWDYRRRQRQRTGTARKVRWILYGAIILAAIIAIATCNLDILPV